MEGLARTLDLLGKTDNEAAVRVLMPALDCPDPAIQEGALVALLSRRNPAGGREILRRLPSMKPQWKAILRQHHGRMTRTLRDAVLDTDPKMCRNGCQAAVWFREYDLIPTLLNLIEDPSRKSVDLAASTLMQLVGHLYEELAGIRDASDRRDPQLIRRHVVSSLEFSMQRFSQHKRREVVEAFLRLVNRENVILRQTLQNPHHPAFVVMLDVLSKSPLGGVVRLLLSFLEDPHVPSAAISVIANRSDPKFIQHLLRKVGREPSATAAQNLKRIETIGWLADAERVLAHLDESCQHAAVRLVMIAGVPRAQAFTLVQYVLLHGKPQGRREAARALGEFNGSEANALALRGLADPDPQVQANIVQQLRRRGIPGVLPALLDLVDSPYEVVQKAARESLAEFTFKRYLAAFDMLDEEVRRSTGVLVKKIDSEAVAQLKDELACPVRSRRLRALAVTRAMEAVDDLKEIVIERLGDEDHLVRVEAAVTLGDSRSAAARAALEHATADSSETVREAAKRSLEGMP